jgi:hypothetical protein
VDQKGKLRPRSSSVRATTAAIVSSALPSSPVVDVNERLRARLSGDVDFAAFVVFPNRDEVRLFMAVNWQLFDGSQLPSLKIRLARCVPDF